MYVDREDTKPQWSVLWCNFYILNYFISNCIMTVYVCRQRGYKAAMVHIMMFFLYIELLYIQLYHDSSCISIERIQSRNGKYYDVLSIYWTTLYRTVSWQCMYVDREDTKLQRLVLWCSFYIFNYFISNWIMTAHVCGQRGYKAATVSIMMFLLYIELLYIQLYHGSSCMWTERIQSRNGSYYDVLSIYWTTLYSTVSWQPMYVDREDKKPQR